MALCQPQVPYTAICAAQPRARGIRCLRFPPAPVMRDGVGGESAIARRCSAHLCGAGWDERCDRSPLAPGYGEPPRFFAR